MSTARTVDQRRSGVDKAGRTTVEPTCGADLDVRERRLWRDAVDHEEAIQITGAAASAAGGTNGLLPALRSGGLKSAALLNDGALGHGWRRYGISAYVGSSLIR